MNRTCNVCGYVAYGTTRAAAEAGVADYCGGSRVNTTLPVEFQMWDAEQCGDYFGCKREHFLRIKRHAEGFPAPLISSDPKRPRWAAKAVIGWALK